MDDIVHYLLFKDTLDYPTAAVIGVYETRGEAENAQLSWQKSDADKWNGLRRSRFEEGLPCQEERQAADFAGYYRVEKVRQLPALRLE